MAATTSSPAASPPHRDRRLVGTSLKMYFTPQQTRDYVSSLASLSPLASSSNVDLFILPDYLSIPSTISALSSTQIITGAQNCSYHNSGAYTGEVSPRSLSQLGCRLVALGHAERRRYFHETDSEIARKVAAVVGNDMVPLICVGEGEKPTGPSMSAAVGAAVSACERQVRAALASVPDDAEVVIAYEPVWAIGADAPAGPDHVVAVCKALRQGCLSGRRASTRILYGGSAGPGTFESLKDAVDGLFLGRFAHDVANLEEVIREMAGP